MQRDINNLQRTLQSLENLRSQYTRGSHKRTDITRVMNHIKARLKRLKSDIEITSCDVEEIDPLHFKVEVIKEDINDPTQYEYIEYDITRGDRIQCAFLSEERRIHLANVLDEIHYNRIPSEFSVSFYEPVNKNVQLDQSTTLSYITKSHDENFTKLYNTYEKMRHMRKIEESEKFINELSTLLVGKLSDNPASYDSIFSSFSFIADRLKIERLNYKIAHTRSLLRESTTHSNTYEKIHQVSDLLLILNKKSVRLDGYLLNFETLLNFFPCN